MDLKSIYNAEEIYKLDNGKYTQELCAYNANCYVFSDGPSTRMANLKTA